MGILQKSFLAAVTLAMAFHGSSKAASVFNYDLRFADGSHSVVVNSNGTYTLQLWGQITGDANPFNDAWAYGVVSAQSTQVFGGAFTAGGITQGTPNSNLFPIGSAGAIANLTNDGVSDWGSNANDISSGWLQWLNATVNDPLGPGYLGGTTIPGQSHAVNANTWEVLVASFTVNVANVATDGLDHQTQFNIVTPTNLTTGPMHIPLAGNIYFPDGATTGSRGATVGPGVAFVVAPAPLPSAATTGLTGMMLGVGILSYRRHALRRTLKAV